MFFKLKSSLVFFSHSGLLSFFFVQACIQPEGHKSRIKSKPGLFFQFKLKLIFFCCFVNFGFFFCFAFCNNCQDWRSATLNGAVRKVRTINVRTTIVKNYRSPNAKCHLLKRLGCILASSFFWLNFWWVIFCSPTRRSDLYGENSLSLV